MDENGVEFKLVDFLHELDGLKDSLAAEYGSMSSAQLLETIAKREKALKKLDRHNTGLVVRETARLPPLNDGLRENHLKYSLRAQGINRVNFFLFERVKAGAELEWLCMRAAGSQSSLTEAKKRRLLEKRAKFISESRAISHEIMGNNLELRGLIDEAKNRRNRLIHLHESRGKEPPAGPRGHHHK